MFAGHSKNIGSVCLAIVIGYTMMEKECAAQGVEAKPLVDEMAARDRTLKRLLRYGRNVPTDQLRAALKHPDSRIRQSALDRWHWQVIQSATTANSPEFIDRKPLFAALDDSSLDVRRVAARLVGEQKQYGKPAVRRLIEILQTDSAEIRAAAALALGQIDVNSPEIHAALSIASRESGIAAAQAIVSLLMLNSDRGVVALRHADDATRLFVASRLASHEITEQKDRAFLLLLSDFHPETRRQALESLDQDAANPELIKSQTLHCLFDPDPAVQTLAASRMESLFDFDAEGIENYRRIATLISKLPADFPKRISAWSGLKRLLESHAVEALEIASDENEDEQLRIELAGALRLIDNNYSDLDGQEYFATEFERIALANNQSLPIRVAFAATLLRQSIVRRGNYAKSRDELEEQFLPLFMEGVQAELFLPIRLMALHEVLLASRNDKSARRVLEDLFQKEFMQPGAKHGSAHWRAEVFEAHCNWLPEGVAPAPLINLGIHDANTELRRAAVDLLSRSVKEKRFQLDETMLLALLDDTDAAVRRLAIEVAVDHAKKSAAVRLRLLKMLDDSDRSVRREVVTTYKQADADFTPVLDRLFEQLAQAELTASNQLPPKGAITVHEVMETLLSVAHDDTRVVEAVMKALNREETLSSALSWLPKLGPAGQAALPTLVELLDEPFPELANNAAESIGYLGPIARSALPKLRELMNKPEYERAAVSVLRLDPTDTKAQDIVAKKLVDELRQMGCHGSWPAWSCVMELKSDGLPTLKKISFDTENERVNSLLKRLLLANLLPYWEFRASPEYDYLEPLLREHLETSDSQLEKRFREGLKRRNERPAR